MAATVAAISQLVATGAIDQELTKNPSVTYWRYQHFRHTAFALENQILEFMGSPNISATNSTCTLHRSGDLVNRMYVIIDLPGIANVSDRAVEFDDADALKTHLSSFNDATQPDSSAMTAAIAAITATSSPVEAVESSMAHRYVAAGGTPFTTPGDDHVPYWCNAVGFRLIKQAVLQIGSQAIDSVYSDYLFMYNELSKKPQKSIDEMIGSGSKAELMRRSKFFRRLHVPLPFFCTKTTGSALPIVSLQFHTVSVVIEWNKIDTCIVNGFKNQSVDITNSTSGRHLKTVKRDNEKNKADYDKGQEFTGMSVYGHSGAYDSGGFMDQTSYVRKTVDSIAEITNADVTFHLECMYVYLDLAERSKFSSGSFQLLMSEAQQNSNEGLKDVPGVEMDLNFNHAVIELLWAVRSKENANNNDWFNYGGVVEPITGMVSDPVKRVKLTLNNSNRFTENNNGQYFRTVQPYQHHSNIPASFVYSYSFGLFPESENPSGQANFSRIDTKKLHLTLDKNMFKDGGACEVIVFARNWNLLRVTLGLAGKAYAN